jgi:hypothetical protein
VISEAQGLLGASGGRSAVADVRVPSLWGLWEDYGRAQGKDLFLLQKSSGVYTPLYITERSLK